MLATYEVCIHVIIYDRTLLPRIQVHALIYVAEARCMQFSESKIAIFRRREKLVRFVYKCLPQIFKATIKQQDSWYEVTIS